MKKFSFSRLELYQTCPRRFYFKYVLGKSEPLTKPLALGKAVHKAIELLINGSSLDDAMAEGMKECDFHEEVSPEEVLELVRNAPLENLKGETEVYFCIPLYIDGDKDSPQLQGYIDLVSGNNIFDFKTNRKMYNVEDTYQVALYAWALSKLKGITTDIQGGLLFLRYQKGSFAQIDEAKMKEAVRWAKQLVNEIRSKLELLEFDPSKHNDIFPYKASSACAHCPFALECYQDNKI